MKEACQIIAGGAKQQGGSTSEVIEGGVDYEGGNIWKKSSSYVLSLKKYNFEI